MLELHYKVFKTFCDADYYEEPEMATDSHYLALYEGILHVLFFPEKRDEWNAIRLRDCTDTFQTQQTIFFPQCAATHTQNAIRGNHVSLGKNLKKHKGCVLE